MKISSIIVLLLFAAWCAFACIWWYPCEVVSQKESKFAGICNSEASIAAATEEASTEPVIAEETSKPKPDYLSFEWSSDEPNVTDAFNAEKEGYIAYLDEDSLNYIEIIGMYSSQETNTSAFSDLGMARAEKIKALFGERLQPQLTVRSMPNSFSARDWIKAVRFNKKRQGIESIEVMEFEDRIVLRFPSGSTEYSSGAILESTLKALASDMNENGYSLLIEGHTDNEGSSESNSALGLKRAKGVMASLVEYGADAQKIEAVTHGEEKPIDSNDSPEGRRNNRRVELIKLK